jgi:hypothetical protein
MDNPNEAFKHRKNTYTHDKAPITESQLIALDHVIHASRVTYVKLAADSLGYVPKIRELTVKEARTILDYGSNLFNNRKLKEWEEEKRHEKHNDRLDR